jgi:hypothetical protein
MGNTQCVSNRNKAISLWNTIEKDLNTKNSKIEKKILNEFINLKRMSIGRKQNQTQKNTRKPSHDIPFEKKEMTGQSLKDLDEMIDKNPSLINTQSNVNLRKRMKIFIKWYNIAFDKNKEESDLNLSFASKGQQSSLNWNISNVEAKISPVKLSRKYSEEFSKFSGVILETRIDIEMNLINYYSKNKIKFNHQISKGPPDSFRWLAWMTSSEIIFKNYNRDIEMSNLLNGEIDHETENQIVKDLNRTFGEEFSYNTKETEVLLYKILKSFAVLDTEVKYCQGMNFIVRFLLMISDFHEEEAFLMLIYLFSSSTFNKNKNCPMDGIRGFFTVDFILLKFYVFAFLYFFQKRLPLLFNHFSQMDLPNEVWITKWMQTLYVIYIPNSCLVRLWDCLFSIGFDFLIDFSLAILKGREAQLIKLQDSFDLVDYFKTEFTSVKFEEEIEQLIKTALDLNLNKADYYAELISEFEEEKCLKLQNSIKDYNPPLIANHYSVISSSNSMTEEELKSKEIHTNNIGNTITRLPSNLISDIYEDDNTSIENESSLCNSERNDHCISNYQYIVNKDVGLNRILKYDG